MRNINIGSKQHRFYILLTTLILSNFTIKSGYALSGWCATDTTGTCYTCNPYTPGTNQYYQHEDIIAGACSDNNDGETWCQSYESYDGGEIKIYNGNAYKCTTNGWQFTDMPGSGGDDTPVSCSAGYYAKTSTGPCVKCPNADFYYAEPEEDYYVPLDIVEAQSPGGTEGIYSCYIAGGNKYMDSTGVFSFTQNCYHGS